MSRRILYLYSKMTPESMKEKNLFAGGAQKRVFQMATHFSINGDTVFLCSDDEDPSLIVSELRKASVNHINIPFRHNILLKIYGIFKLIAIVRKHRIEIVHCNDRFTTLYGKIISILTSAKSVYTARNTFNDKKITKWLLGENIIAVSNGVKKNLIHKFNIKPKNISVIYNGSDIIHSTESERIIVLKKFGLKTTDRIVSSIGRLSEQKGLVFLLNSLPNLIHEFDNLKLLLVGDGELKMELKKIVFNLRLDDYVIFCGNQKNIQVYYDISEFTIMPSLWEGFPGTVIESLMLCKPVIGTEVAGIPEIIQNKTNGLLVPPKNSRELTRAIKYLLDNPKIASKMGVKGKEISMKQFTLSKMLEEYSRYYDLLFPGIFSIK